MRKRIVKVLLFVVILAAVVLGLQSIFNVGNAHIGYQSITGFYDEPAGSLDAVYIGASNVYSFFQAPLAWQEYGMAVYPLSVSNLPAQAFRYEIEEARKTQPDALYILQLNCFKTMSVTEGAAHTLADYMPLSATKVRMLRALSGELGKDGLSQAEFYLPIIRFHSRWPELSSFDFLHEPENVKGGSTHLGFLTRELTGTVIINHTESRVPLDEKQRSCLTELLDYCDNEGVQVLFVAAPQTFEDESEFAQLNTMLDLIEARGYQALDLRQALEAMDADITADYRDDGHMNIHGALKYSHYLGSYLLEHYGFSDKRGDAAYASWDAAAERYEQLIAPYTLDFERQHEDRAYTLDASELTEVRATGCSFRLKWTGSEGADGYVIYRKQRDTDSPDRRDLPWEQVAVVDRDILAYWDRGLSLGATYTYTVAPFISRGGEKQFGKYDANGRSGTTILDAPLLLSLEKTDALTLSWKAMPGVDGYAVYRKIPGQSWTRIANVSKETTSYTDLYYQEGIPYQYSAGAYQKLESGVSYGYYHHSGLLYMQELKAPEPTIGMAPDGSALLRWDSVKGASSYSVYRQTAQGAWQLLTDELGAQAAEYVDPQPPENAVYKVSAVLKYEEELYEYPSDEVALSTGK